MQNKRTKESILKEWSKLAGKSCIGEISKEDELEFRRIKAMEKLSKEINFILGGRLNEA